MSPRVAIVTGGASGIGRATAELLEARGDRVAVFDLRGGIRVDVSDAASVEAGVAEVHSTLGPVDILVHAAGVPRAGHSTPSRTWMRGTRRCR